MSEFGKVVGSAKDGRIILQEDGKIVFVSSAFNPLVANDLRNIASLMEDLSDPFHDEGNATNHRLSQCGDCCS